MLKKFRKNKTPQTTEESGAGKSGRPDIESVSPALNSRFYGEHLFRKSRYRLLIRDFTLLNDCKNIFFFRALFDHAGVNNDVSMIPALNAITAAKGTDESLRQEASTIAAGLERIKTGKVQALRDHKPGVADKKRFEAYMLLAGDREPTALDILRLLRSSDAETRRTGIYLAGKFRFREMIPEVCDALDTEGLEFDAVSVIESFGENALVYVRDKLLKSTGNIKTTSLIAYLAGKYTSPESNEILLYCLFSYSKPAFRIAYSILKDRKLSLSEGEKEKLTSLAYSIATRLQLYINAMESAPETGNEDLIDAFNEEILLCRSSLSAISGMIMPGDESVIKLKEAVRESGFLYSDDIYAFRLEEILRIKRLAGFFTEQGKNSGTGRRKKVPSADLNSFLTDIINSDFIFSGIWLKACLLRAIHKPLNEDLRLSLAALLFSPLRLMAEEAALAAFRTDINIYESVSSRIPVKLRAHLDVLKNNPDYENLIFNKVKAVKTIFPELTADEALILAGNAGFENILGKNDSKILNDIPDASLLQDSLVVKAYIGGKEKILILPLRALEEMILINPHREEYILERVYDTEKKNLTSFNGTENQPQ